MGEEQIGKTSLAKILYRNYHMNNTIPLYIDASEIKNTDTKRALTKSVENQYEKLSWKQFVDHTSPKLLIVDNYNDLGLNGRYEERFLINARKMFEHIVLLSDRSILHDEDRAIETITFPRWELLPFGHLRRGELIEAQFQLRVELTH